VNDAYGVIQGERGKRDRVKKLMCKKFCREAGGESALCKKTTCKKTHV
jgi:hypothetical protein